MSDSCRLTDKKGKATERKVMKDGEKTLYTPERACSKGNAHVLHVAFFVTTTHIVYAWQALCNHKLTVENPKSLQPCSSCD